MRKFFPMTIQEYDKLNPPVLLVKYDAERGIDLIEMLNDPRWLDVGYIPTPHSRLGWFAYHFFHGIAMRYPIHKVIAYSLVNTKPDK